MIGNEYARARRRAAFVTALDHPDAAVRERAETRVRRWTDVVAGMASGALRIGSRTPLAGVPVWATPTVLRGGFVTGELAAGGPLSDDERASAREHGLPEERAALFRHALTAGGLAELDARLADGCYRAEHAEETALLTVAWLHHVGEHLAADRLVAELRPWADRLRFTPRPATSPVVGSDLVSRATVTDTRAALRARAENPHVARMRETLTVWLPLRDDLLAHWRSTVRDGRVGAHRPPQWVAASRSLLARYETLAAQHRLCRTHVRSRDNLAIMLRVLRAVLEGDDRELPLLAVRMARMTGTPPERLRAAYRPTHPQLARAVSKRLDGLDATAGIDEPDAVLTLVTPAELGRPHLSAAGPDAVASFLASERTFPGSVVDPMCRLLDGLRSAHAGPGLAGTRAPRTSAELGSHPFLGWVADGEHPVLGYRST